MKIITKKADIEEARNGTILLFLVWVLITGISWQAGLWLLWTVCPMVLGMFWLEDEL